MKFQEFSYYCFAVCTVYGSDGIDFDDIINYVSNRCLWKSKLLRYCKHICAWKCFPLFYDTGRQLCISVYKQVQGDGFAL